MAKAGTKMAYICLLDTEQDGTWVTDFNNGVYTTTDGVLVKLETETPLTLETEASVEIDLGYYGTDEVYTIPFMGNETRQVESDIP